jgi:hypothetical protein
MTTPQVVAEILKHHIAPEVKRINRRVFHPSYRPDWGGDQQVPQLCPLYPGARTDPPTGAPARSDSGTGHFASFINGLIGRLAARKNAEVLSSLPL